ncbi:MAG: hypothetical protein G5Z42_07155 [Caldisphaeraceae archaeon]|nr:hypothetical protein [Caldisphaeraceae archaeon]MEB3798574.1 hypothetical protein [Caldisphaeraceae archaeon]
MKKKVIALLAMLSIALFILPIGHALQVGNLKVDQYGNIAGYFIINVTNAPEEITIKIPGSLIAYEAVSNNNTLPANYSDGVLKVLATSNAIVNISFISANATKIQGGIIVLYLDVPSLTEIELPPNSVLIYANSSISSIKNGTTILVNPGDFVLEYALSTTTSSKSSTTTTSSAPTTSTTTSSSTTKPLTSSTITTSSTTTKPVSTTTKTTATTSTTTSSSTTKPLTSSTITTSKSKTVTTSTTTSSTTTTSSAPTTSTTTSSSTTKPLTSSTKPLKVNYGIYIIVAIIIIVIVVAVSLLARRR